MISKCIHILQKQPQKDTPGFNKTKYLDVKKNNNVIL